MTAAPPKVRRFGSSCRLQSHTESQISHGVASASLMTSRFVVSMIQEKKKKDRN